jgi:hypothetical protein
MMIQIPDKLKKKGNKICSLRKTREETFSTRMAK